MPINELIAKTKWFLNLLKMCNIIIKDDITDVNTPQSELIKK